VGAGLPSICDRLSLLAPALLALALRRLSHFVPARKPLLPEHFPRARCCLLKCRLFRIWMFPPALKNCYLSSGKINELVSQQQSGEILWFAQST
jgi:hypothetical protein